MFPPSPGAAGGGVVRVAVAVVSRESTDPATECFYLIGHRMPGGHLPDLWEFPGGKIEAGESPVECALRELREETGVDATWRAHLLTVTHPYPDRTVEIEFHLCDYLGGQPWPVSAQAVRWARATHLECYRFPEGSRAVLAFLGSNGPELDPG